MKLELPMAPRWPLERPLRATFVKIAPIVEKYGQKFAEIFDNRCQFQHFANYLTGLMAQPLERAARPQRATFTLPNKSMANISRCIVESADKTNLSRFFSEAPWPLGRATLDGEGGE